MLSSPKLSIKSIGDNANLMNARHAIHFPVDADADSFDVRRALLMLCCGDSAGCWWWQRRQNNNNERALIALHCAVTHTYTPKQYKSRTPAATRQIHVSARRLSFTSRRLHPLPSQTSDWCEPK